MKKLISCIVFIYVLFSFNGCDPIDFTIVKIENNSSCDLHISFVINLENFLDYIELDVKKDETNSFVLESIGGYHNPNDYFTNIILSELDTMENIKDVIVNRNNILFQKDKIEKTGLNTKAYFSLTVTDDLLH